MQSELYLIATTGGITPARVVTDEEITELSLSWQAKYQSDHIQFLTGHSPAKIEPFLHFTPQNDVLRQPDMQTLKEREAVSPCLDGSCLNSASILSQEESEKSPPRKEVASFPPPPEGVEGGSNSQFL